MKPAVQRVPAQPPTVVMTCARCAARIMIACVPDSPYPVKLPGSCPCCFAKIEAYQILDERSAA